jgi:transglutaminase-like putative cysteine protease
LTERIDRPARSRKITAMNEGLAVDQLPEEARVYLAPAEYIDSDHPAIRARADEIMRAHATPQARARAAYLVAREIRYGYVDHADPEVYRASSVLAAGYGYCVGKAAVFAALCRACGIPARVAFADVTNHLSTERLSTGMGTNVFAWHGFTEIMLDGKWLKASPTFNASLCARYGVAPLEFDGASDALLQAFDAEGRTFMRYERMRESFHDVPAKFLHLEMERLYPELVRSEDLKGRTMEEDLATA